MKQLNGTVTLSFLEEDNQQRVIFRVVPLCTREGLIFQSQKSEFPDQGSLRIVPDKREQSTFKERMRSMGCLCAIHLCSEGKELTKVRQNRNYDPGQGECNQFAIYSDVVCEFADDGVFEVFDEDSDFSGALSSRVLLRRGKVLYGPVEKTDTPDWEQLHPFGNDSYLLHTVTLVEGEHRCFYWNPEQTINWRQRRGTLRRMKSHSEGKRDVSSMQSDDEIAAAPEGQASRMQDAPEQTTEEETQYTQPEQSFAPILAEADDDAPGDTALPIGTKLDILDASISFEEQISKLDQPLSSDANLLSHKHAPIVAHLRTEPEKPVHFSGTPLVKASAKIPVPVRNGENFREVVENQIRVVHQMPDAYPSDFAYVENPVENINAALDAAWSSPERQQQVLDSLCANTTFADAFQRRLRHCGKMQNAVSAAQQQLEDLEAERLSLLVQIDALKNDEKAAREKLLSELNRQKQEELTAITSRIATAQAEYDTIGDMLKTMEDSMRGNALEVLVENGVQFCASAGDTVVIAPVRGQKRTCSELSDTVRMALTSHGFACTQDDARELLLFFTLFDEFALTAATESVAELCARAMLEGLGLSKVTAFTHADTRLVVASVLPDRGLRTPTVEVCSANREKLNPYGHKTIRLMDMQTAAHSALPVVAAPQYKPNGHEIQVMLPQQPVALQTFETLCEDASPLLSQGEAWMSELETALAQQDEPLSAITCQQMRLFIGAAASVLRGGFLAAADAAVLSWIIPLIRTRTLNVQALKPVLESLPRALSTLGIE